MFVLGNVPAVLTVAWFSNLERIIKKRFKIHAPISLSFVSPGRMQSLNRYFRNKNKPTDILSFRYSDAPQKIKRVTKSPASTHWPLSRDDFSGEIILCLAVMRKKAKEKGRSLSDEFRFIVIHGVLHVLGFDHKTDKEAKFMEAMERNILVELQKSLTRS